jgi:ABC-type transport system substrate-binding protein
VALPWTPENLDPTMNLSSIRAKVGVLQLRLRRGVVFHDGEPFNAEAVRFTFERVLDPNQRHLRDRRPRDLDAAYGPVAAAPRGHPPVGLHREVLTRAANRS